MKSWYVSVRLALRLVVLLACSIALWPATPAHAQGVTTGAITGVVTNDQGQPVSGASVIAIHLPSGTSYETTTRADGRFSIPGMRVGGPYSVTVSYSGSGGTAFQPQTEDNIMVNLGVATDLPVKVQAIALQETVTVTAEIDPVFSSSRTGASTSVTRMDIADLPDDHRQDQRHHAVDAAGEPATRSRGRTTGRTT